MNKTLMILQRISELQMLIEDQDELTPAESCALKLINNGTGVLLQSLCSDDSDEGKAMIYAAVYGNAQNHAPQPV